MNLHLASTETLSPATEPQPDVRRELELTTSAVLAAHDADLAETIRSGGWERRGLLRTLRRAR